MNLQEHVMPAGVGRERPESGSLRSSGASPRQRITRRPLHGVLLLDKPLGLSSNDAMQKAKWLLRAEKAGHTGTLDPLATGLLPLCFGAATKFSQVSLDADKRYLATVQFGVTTTTGDREGEVVARAEVTFDRAALVAACASLTGFIEQVPPMHSALKHEGKALYEWARAGVELDRPARAVMIHGIDIVGGQDALWTLDVRCSKGTYIRTLAEDLGRVLGCGAHLAGLRRTASGHLKLEGAITLEALAEMPEPAREACLLGADELVREVPAVELPEELAGRFLSGVRLRRSEFDSGLDSPLVRVYGPQGMARGAFLGTAHIVAGELISKRLLSPVEVQGLLDQYRQISPNSQAFQRVTP
jgi:tRNA pseudouridine55 synthase